MNDLDFARSVPAVQGLFKQPKKEKDEGGGILGNITKIAMLIDRFRDILAPLIALYRTLNPKPDAEPPEPTEKPPATPTPPVNPPPGNSVGSSDSTVISSLRIPNNRPYFCEQNSAQAGRRGVIYPKSVFDEMLKPNGQYVQVAGDWMHLNVSPYDQAGIEIGPDDARLELLMGRDNNPAAPKIQWRWWSDGVEQSNSGHDRFHLSSYEDDYGCTPVLKLTSAEPGRHKIEAQAYIEAKDNGGLFVQSVVITWYSD